MQTPYFWQHRSFISYLLLPASWLYWFASHMRRLFTKTRKATVPVICVGNAVAGGAGKTPVALALADMLASSGKRIFFLSRGYGGNITQSTLVDTVIHTAENVGDEALLLAARLPTVIGADRVKSATLSVQLGAQIIIMDDGYQNPSLHKDLCLLVIDSAYGMGNGFLLPAGPLRESMDVALARADAVVAMRSDDTERFLPIHPKFTRARLEPVNAADIAGKSVVAFAGIARPEKFFATVRACGSTILKAHAFADHHAYHNDEIETLLKEAASLEATLVTTEKDAVKIPAHYMEHIVVLKVRAVFDDTQLLLALQKAIKL